MLFLGGHVAPEKRHGCSQELINRGDTRLCKHPIRKRKNWIANAVPCSLRGDVAPVFKVGKPGSNSLGCYSIMSLRGIGTTLSLKLLVFMMCLQILCATMATMAMINGRKYG